MANQERSFEVGGTTFTIRFTQNALYRMEEKLGSFLAIANRLGAREAQVMMWAGLEGARLKNKSRRQEYTLDEAGDLIDELGGLAQAVPIIIDAFNAAFPQKKETGDDDAVDPT